MSAYRRLSFLAAVGTLLMEATAAGQTPPKRPAGEPAALKVWPNLTTNIERPLRYRPEGTDFVIENGPEFFNRPLYGGNTAFRVDGGDKPEFTLYLPGRGGNLRLGLHNAAGTKWLHTAEKITTRYRPGSLIHEIHDPLIGPEGMVRITSLALDQTDGLIVSVEASSVPADSELIVAFGGVTGKRGRRDGDIGTEAVPIGEYFQLKPEFCADNTFEIKNATFTLRSKPATVLGLMPPGMRLTTANAGHWDDPKSLFFVVPDQTPAFPVAIGRVPITNGQALLLALQRINAAPSPAELDTYRNVTAERPGQTQPAPPAVKLAPSFTQADLPRIFAETQAHFEALRTHVRVDTPDPYLNAAVASLNIAADAVWDEPQGAVMHGAIAWRTKLLGWRGPYVMDALGWHDRARRHLSYWSTRQNVSPITEKIPPPDERDNLARSETALHSNGDLSNSHYDMNLVYIDAVFRHLLWTGDLEFARQVWPVIERHLAWERRLFRREFTTSSGEKLPLYEAYAAIWASDDLQYHGGGVTHATAYNYYHNKMAARIAKLLGEDPAPYEKEAKLIGKGLRELLWMPQQGMFAEFKDYLGLQRIHPSAGLWTFYHAMDSEVPSPAEAWQMSRYIDTQMPHIPVRGPGVPDGLYSLPTTNWMPYTWSINNVVMGEVAHTALGFWQAGRHDDAWRMLKGPLVAAMFMGISPGNVGSMSYLDVYRRESQRDFADGSGVLSRAIVEGLFGVKPDALAGELTVAPGFPTDWNHAQLVHPDVTVEFNRQKNTDRFLVETRFPKPMTLRLKLPAQTATPEIRVNGQLVAGRLDQSNPRSPQIEISSPSSSKNEIVVTWKGPALSTPSISEERWDAKNAREALSKLPPKSAAATATKWETVDLTACFNDRVTQIFKNEYRSPRSPFVSLAIPKQGIGSWASHIDATAEIDDSGLRAAAKDGRFVLPDGTPFATPGSGDARNIVFTSQWDNYPREMSMSLSGRATAVHLLMTGSTNWMQSRLDNGEVVVTYADGSTSRLALENPTTWWPIEQDYFIDDYQFRIDAPLPARVDLKTGRVRVLDANAFKGKGTTVPGGAATVLVLPLDPAKELKSLTVRCLSNEVVIGLMSATLARPEK